MSNDADFVGIVQPNAHAGVMCAMLPAADRKFFERDVGLRFESQGGRVDFGVLVKSPYHKKPVI